MLLMMFEMSGCEAICACSGDEIPGAWGVLGDHAHRRGRRRALSVQVGNVFAPAAAKRAGEIGRAPTHQPSRREAPRAHAGREGVVGEQACVVPELGR